MRILVNCAGGNQGRILLPRLHEAGLAVRAIRASPEHEAQTMQMGAAEVFVGDASDRAFLCRAMAGVDAVYHIAPTAHPREREMGWAMIEMAREHGVGHFIYSSVLHPIASAMLQHKAKRDVEERLIEANIPFTILQPADYMMENVIFEAMDCRVWRQLYDLDRVQAMIALEDVADVVCKVAIERERHFGATYELAAPGNFSGNHIAALIARITGQPMKTELVSPDDYLMAFYGQGGGYPHAMIRSVATWYGQYDFAGNSNVLTWLLGRTPTTLEAFAERIWHARQQR